MTDQTTICSYQVSPYRFTDRPVEMRCFLEAVGLRPEITKDGFALLGGAAGMMAIHPLATADTTDRVSTALCLQTADARAAAEALTLNGLSARWWDEAFGRRAAVAGPEDEISINEPMTDAYGYTTHRSEDTAAGVDVDVVAVLFTPNLDHWEVFFHGLGFTATSTAPGWHELRAGHTSGVIGLHESETTSPTCGRYAISFKTSEPLPEFVVRMRTLGYPVTEEPDAQAPHVTVTDPDGIAIEIHER
jgi:catechol 2,3-dioxygenase-like lactoylglutathione lyase family enzyme